jgi:uncharacterized protein (TIGR02246 family)
MEHRFHNTEHFEFVGDQVASIEVFFGLPPSGKVDTPNEVEIQRLLDERAAALHAKDARRLTAVYAKTATSFGLAPPLVIQGKDLLDPASLTAWFASWKGGIETELRDLKIIADRRVAVATALENMSGDKPDGSHTSLWYRASFAFVVEDGAWKIANVHQSVPMSMDGGNKALVDLEP